MRRGMDWMIYPGAAVTLAGIGGLAYCIWKANRLRTSGLTGEPLARELQRLIPINIGSVFVSAIGLAMVVIGKLL